MRWMFGREYLRLELSGNSGWLLNIICYIYFARYVHEMPFLCTQAPESTWYILPSNAVVASFATTAEICF